jgi:transcriptional regulator with XRE-family HTH domain
MTNKKFASTLRYLLESRGASQKWLAEKALTTEATISRYLSGKNQPEIEIVTKIARVLNVSMDYLCDLCDSPTPKESLGAEAIMLLRCYDRADAHDKKILWTILERYMTAHEKENPISSSFTGTGIARVN